MQIEIIPDDYYHAKELATAIEGIIKKHPLVSVSAIRECIHNTPIQAKICDYKNETGQVIRLEIDPNTKDFEKVLYHEFTHVIDRLDSNFGIDCQSEARAKNILPEGIGRGDFRLYMHLWDCYIDGRLEQFGENPRSFQSRVKEFHDCSSNFGEFTSEVDDVLQKIWSNKNLTFQDLLEFARKCLQYWQPKQMARGLKRTKPL